jgi:lysophospholipase L1-like esterase
MSNSVWQWVLFVLVVGVPAVLGRRGRRDMAVVVAMVGLILGCALVLFDPDGRTRAASFATVGLVVFDIFVFCARAGFEHGLIRRVRTPAGKIVLTLLAVLVVPLGSIELTCRLLTGVGVLRYHQAMQTVWRSGHDDWRLATITGDENREPDPVLLWRPSAHKPFNSDRFKGPEILDPKPSEVVRVMCYGDSLTDGPPKGGWPRWLERLLGERSPVPGRRFEVLNAGVAGYSSHQGLLRFLQEVDRYRPELLVVSFGWNDAAEAIGQPDKTFQVPPWPIVACQRALVRYRSYLVLMYYTRKWRAQPAAAPAGPSHPRVSLEDYVSNMERFQAEAEARGIPVAFLTRPHKMPVSLLAKDSTWRGSVPAYNEALRSWTKRRGVPLIDLEQAFEAMPSELFSDECHFTPAGYEKMAEMVRARLEIGPAGVVEFAGDGGAIRSAPRIAAPEAQPTRR